MRSLLTTFLLGVILSSVGYAKETTGNVTILCYHTFLGKPKIVTDFSIAEFADQIDTLRKKGYQFVTFDQMKKGQINGKSVLLVIDDGNISAYSAYEQVLKPRHIKAMFAIYPGIVNRVKFAMTWDQVRQLVADGNEIASHGYFHEFLNKDLQTTRPKDFVNEAALSKQILEKQLNISIDTYVYPFGVCTTEGKTLLKENQYRYAMTIIPGKVRIPMEKNPNPLQLPRTMLTRSTARSVISAL